MWPKYPKQARRGPRSRKTAAAMRRPKRAAGEAGLHGDGEPRASAVPERPRARERGEHGRGAEPEREGAQLGGGEEGEGSPAARGRVGAGQLGQSFFI